MAYLNLDTFLYNTIKLHIIHHMFEKQRFVIDHETATNYNKMTEESW